PPTGRNRRGADKQQPHGPESIPALDQAEQDDQQRHQRKEQVAAAAFVSLPRLGWMSLGHRPLPTVRSRSSRSKISLAGSPLAAQTTATPKRPNVRRSRE